MARTLHLSTVLKLGTAAAALAAASPAFAQAPEQAERAAAASTPDVPETADATLPGSDIVVTARRRAESLQDVPISVTALDGQALENRGAVDLTAVMQQTPNTTLQIARGSNSTLIAFIRGIGQQDPLWGFEPGVGLYVDDVYVARPQGAVLDIFDIERIEILRGPQGTLYGRNTIGGAVKYVTRRLGETFEGRVRASYGSYNQIDLVGSVAVPLGAGLAAGGAVAWLQRDGFGTNLTTGNEHYNKDVLAGRVSLEYEPTADLFFRLSGDWIQDNSNARHGSRLTGNAGLADFAPLASVYDTRAGAGDRNRVRTRGTSFTGEYRATPEVTLKSITAYRDGETRGQIDFDNAPGPVLDIPAFYEDEQFSQEVQLVYEGNTVQGVAGLFYLDSEAAGAFDTVLGLANLTIFTTGSVKTRSIAGFADMNINLSPFWRVSLGGRYTSDRRTGTVYRQNFTGIRSPFFGNNAAVPGLVRSNFTNTRTDDQFTPRASISWLPDRDTTLYASYSKGFKAGGFDMRSDVILVPQAVRGYEPETVDAYEVGLKTYLFDRSLYLSFAAFYSDYQNQQFTVQVPVGANVASMVENAGDSRIFGVEAEWRAVVTDNFSVSGMFGYTDARFKRLTTFDPVQQRFVDRSNEWVFQNTPRFTFAVSPTISTDLAGGTLAFTPSMSFRSEYSQFEIPNPLLDEDGYVLVDASLVWTSPDQRFQISAHGRNLLDERYRIGGYNFPGALFGNSIIGFYGPPRTFTITGQVRF